MIRPPSNQKPYTAFWSGDPAFVQLPSEPTDEQRAEHERKWTTARETADYSALLVEGAGEPTAFQMRPLTLDQLVAIHEEGKSSEVKGHVLAFCIALVDVANFSKVDIKRVQHKRLGLIATTEFLDKAGLPAGMSARIAIELGMHAVQKAHSLSPK